jgi:hypothetical protein
MHTSTSDPRHIANGNIIPSTGYVDQPYVVVLADKSWLCLLTTASGAEGEAGQHILAVRSKDQGKSWSTPVAIEPPDGPEASWVVPLLVPSLNGGQGRVYAFYVYNGDNLREVITDTGTTDRVDTLGYYVFRYSDDGGTTWSATRHVIPIRNFEVDKKNPYGGKVQFFWCVCKPLIHENKVFIAVHKVGGFNHFFMTRSEGCFLVSDNILTESDPARIRFDTLPDGEIGLRAVCGPVAEEQSVTALSDGTLFCAWRTVEGHPCQAYSRDGGHTWTSSEYFVESPGGRRIKNPRAANFVRRFSNGNFLYWFENHGNNDYGGRNPAWLLGGEEVDTPAGKCITWSQPEVVLYDDPVDSRMSYPDFIEQDGAVFITETQKAIARSHLVPECILESLWQGAYLSAVSRQGLIGEFKKGESAMPPLPLLGRDRGGFTIDMVIRFDEVSSAQLLFDSRDAAGRGISVTLTDRCTLKIILCGEMQHGGIGFTGTGLAECSWECDAGLLQEGKRHCATVTVDGGPKLIQWIIDEKLCDGGEIRTAGWGRFHPSLSDINGASTAQIAPSLKGEMEVLRLYDRALLNNEAASNHRGAELA